MATKHLSKKVFIILMIVIPTVILTTILLLNIDKISTSKYEADSALLIEGMTCESCSKTISDDLKKTAGVKEVVVDFETKKASVTYDKRKTDINKIRKTIRDSGYKVEDENKLEVVNFKIKYN